MWTRCHSKEFEMHRTVFLFAPQGSGKSRHAEQISAMLGCVGIVEDWSYGQPVKEDHLHLSNDHPPVGQGLIQRVGPACSAKS
jgi:predicted Ser/Thr protein kinase